MAQATLFDEPPRMRGTARFSPCGLYRYTLTREWDAALPLLVCCALNPSTATAATNDPTVAKEVRLAKRWGCGGLLKVNLYAWRSTDPRGLLTAADPVGPENDDAIADAFSRRGSRLLLCWGRNATRERARRVVRMALALHGAPEAMNITNTGEPGHVLYLPENREPFRFHGYAEES